MSDEFLYVITFIAALGAGLVAGIFFAFSTFVMKALHRLPPVQGIAAMQSINVVVINPWFMTVFFGTAAACIILVIFSFLGWGRPSTGYLFLGCILYLFGTILVTITCNVPRNEALAAVDPASAEGASLWADYAKSWTTWNHVRTVAALAAALSLTIALCF